MLVPSPLARRGFLIVAVVTIWSALVLQAYLTIDPTRGGGKSTVDGLIVFISYFTVLTNILAALAWTVALVGGRDRPDPRLSAAVLVYIAIVAGIYFSLLRNLWAPQGAQWLADVTLHYGTPILFAVYWLLFVVKGRLTWRDPILWLAYPLVYGAVTFVRAASTGFYPYPFIDVAALGVARVAINSLGVLLIFLAVGALVVLVDRRLAKARN